MFVYSSVCRCLRAQDRPQFVWQGQVDGTAILHLAGKRLAVQIQDGAPVERQKFHFSDALPETQQNVRVEVLEGRGYVHVVDQPSIENHYTLAVAIEDRQPGSSFYSIALYWDASSNAFERGAEKTDHVAWTGRVDEAAIISCHKQSCVSSVEQTARRWRRSTSSFREPLPERDYRGSAGRSRGPRRDPFDRAAAPAQQLHRARFDSRSARGRGRVFVHPGVESQPSRSKESAPIPDSSGRGFLWNGTVDGRVRVTLQGGASFSEVLEGARHQRRAWRNAAAITGACGSDAEDSKTARPRAGVDRGIAVGEEQLPAWFLRSTIPQPGADYYEIELDW